MMRRVRASLAAASAALALGVGAAMPEDWLQRMDEAFRTAWRRFRKRWKRFDRALDEGAACGGSR